MSDFDGREVTYGFGELDELVLALRDNNPQELRLGIPSRGHPIDDLPLSDATAKPGLYGVTRGKRLAVLIGQRKALAIAVKGARTRRWSKLREWLIP
jgi:exodeoxyribonuclease V alpha subunit